MGLSDRLNSPIKRIGFVVSIVGAFLFVVSAVGYAIDHTPFAYVDDFFRNALDSNQRRYNWYYLFAWIGFWSCLSGTVVAWFYDKTIGRVVTWIRDGK